MKKFWKEFLLRGLICASGGPIVLAIIYGILGATGTANAIPPREVCLGILTITLLAFIAAGMTAIYQMEQLPLPIMILLHGGGLYIAYILTYLLNNWLKNSLVPILVFTGIFVVGYALIWLIIYCVTKSKTEALNRKLKEKL
ncbi:MAG: DUF3021 domain-containing protein [Oscillospiraceae bacterium]|nr:DUF3021 domain-containing protein [Oscillospiraceae bacterium]